MTDNEIKKALELCGSEYECHNGCPYYNNGKFKCRDLSIYRDALDLINRLETKNSNLTSDLTSLQNDLTSLKNAYKQCTWERDAYIEIENTAIAEAKAEAYKEFAKKSEIELYVKRNERQKHWEEYLKQHNTTKDYQVHEWSVDNWLRGYGEAVQDIVSINDNLLKEKVGEDNA